jgi:hypothetical protein
MWIGGSSACYALLWRHHWLFVLQAAVSFASDYVYAGRPSLTHGMDRWMSTLMTLWFAPIRLVCLVPVYCIWRSKHAKTFSEYETWHTCWHVLGPLVGLYALGT